MEAVKTKKIRPIPRYIKSVLHQKINKQVKIYFLKLLQDKNFLFEFFLQYRKKIIFT